MTSFGFHLGIGGNAVGIKKDYLIPLDAAGIPATIVSIGEYGICQDAVNLSRISGVGHTSVYRVVGLDVPDYSLSPRDAAIKHWDAILARLPDNFDKQVWIVPVNEVDKDRSEWLAEFHLELSFITIPFGYRILCFGWSAGEPEYGHWEGPKMLQLLEQCAAHRDHLGIALHEYSYDVNDIKRWFPYLIGRFQFLFDVCDTYRITRPVVVITEWGWEYQAVPSVASSMKDIAWADAVYRTYPDVLGMAIWYLGGGFGNIANAAQPLIAPVGRYMLENPPVEPPEPPVEPPVDETLEQWLWRRSVEIQEESGISLNADAALQNALREYGTTPVHTETWETYPGDEAQYAFQAGENVADGDRVVAALPVPQWDKIFYVTQDETEPPEPPVDTFKLTHLPTADETITQGFGDNPEDYAEFGLPGHDGIDFRAPTGALIYCSADGVVTRVHLLNRDGWHNYGNHVRVDHPGGYQTIYGHLSKVMDGVAPGIIVQSGDYLGESGNTGNSYGAHLHFGMKHFPDGMEGWPYNLIDPTPFIEPLLTDTPGVKVDLLPYMAGVLSGRGPLYELQIHGGPQERVQTQWESNRFYITKGNEVAANWEERWVSGGSIYFGTDTSESQERYYTQRLNGYGAPWVARYMHEGESFYRNPLVTHYRQRDCRAEQSEQVGSWMRVVKFHQFYTFESGIVLPDTVELAWSWGENGEPLERYLYSKDYGLTGWYSSNGPFSYVSEIHDPGQRPDNRMVTVSCLVKS